MIGLHDESDFVTNMSIKRGITAAKYSSGIKWVEDPNFHDIPCVARIVFNAVYQRKEHYTQGTQTTEKMKDFVFPYGGKPLETYNLISGEKTITTPNDSLGFYYWSSFNVYSYVYINYTSSDKNFNIDNWSYMSGVWAAKSEVDADMMS